MRGRKRRAVGEWRAGQGAAEAGGEPPGWKGGEGNTQKEIGEEWGTGDGRQVQGGRGHRDRVATIAGLVESGGRASGHRRRLRNRRARRAARGPHTKHFGTDCDPPMSAKYSQNGSLA